MNVACHSTINLVHGLQGVANSVGKMDAYLRLIQQTQVESYNEDMQALHDVLSGTLLDLYEVVREILISIMPDKLINQLNLKKRSYIKPSTAITYLLLKLHFSRRRRNNFE